MINPYKPGTKEYDLLQNLIQLADHIDDYVAHCAPLEQEIKCDVIRDMVAHAKRDHEEILKGK